MRKLQSEKYSTCILRVAVLFFIMALISCSPTIGKSTPGSTVNSSGEGSLFLGSCFLEETVKAQAPDPDYVNRRCSEKYAKKNTSISVAQEDANKHCMLGEVYRPNEKCPLTFSDGQKAHGYCDIYFNNKDDSYPGIFMNKKFTYTSDYVLNQSLDIDANTEFCNFLKEDGESGGYIKL